MNRSNLRLPSEHKPILWHIDKNAGFCIIFLKLSTSKTRVFGARLRNFWLFRFWNMYGILLYTISLRCMPPSTGHFKQRTDDDHRNTVYFWKLRVGRWPRVTSIVHYMTHLSHVTPLVHMINVLWWVEYELRFVGPSLGSNQQWHIKKIPCWIVWNITKTIQNY